MKRIRLYLVLALSSLFVFGTSDSYAQGSSDRKKDKRWDKRNKDWKPGKGKDERWGRTSERVYPYARLKVPKGHLPPPGECRIWLPGVPPGQQPPPQSCRSAAYEVPRGAWVITHDGDRYRVNMYSPSRPSVIREVRYYLLR